MYTNLSRTGLHYKYIIESLVWIEITQTPIVIHCRQNIRKIIWTQNLKRLVESTRASVSLSIVNTNYLTLCTKSAKSNHKTVTVRHVRITKSVEFYVNRRGHMAAPCTLGNTILCAYDITIALLKYMAWNVRRSRSKFRMSMRAFNVCPVLNAKV